MGVDRPEGLPAFGLGQAVCVRLAVSSDATTLGLMIDAPQQVQWEYFVAPVLSHVARQILNNFGAEGWELVQLAPGPNPDSLVGYFKRPVVKES